MQSAITIVTNALKNTRDNEPEHWQRCLVQRAGKEDGHLGSYFPHFNAAQLSEIIFQLVWEPYNHVDVQAPAQAFIARNFPGRFGMVQFGDIPEDGELELVASKEADKVELVWCNHNSKGIEVDYVVMLLWSDEHDGNLIMWTFHPGDPIKPQTFDRYANGHDQVGMKLSKDTASQLAPKWVKLG